MSRALTVVMYHYVRDLAGGRFPHIRGLETALFENQLGYFARYYSFVTPSECLDAIAGADLPRNPLLLTFDDGLADHFRNARPLMKRVGARGVFFVNARVLAEECVLDVHKIHFVLACCPNVGRILQEIRGWLRERDTSGRLAALAGTDGGRNRNDTRYDSDDVVVVKRMLQRDLPAEIRRELCHELFMRHVTTDEAGFSADLYLSRSQLKEMKCDGFTIGNHGYDHIWLDSIEPGAQARELSCSLEAFGDLLDGPGRWVFSYPYGAHNAMAKEWLTSNACGMAFLSAPGLAALVRESRLELRRFDTNDFPKTEGAAANGLTRRSIGMDDAGENSEGS